jgi:hypothetical protein
MQSKHEVELEDTTYLNAEGDAVPGGVSLLDPKICSAILCNYAKLKEDGFGRFNSDLYYLMEAFDEISEIALKDFPMYERIVTYKIDGLQNI